MPAKSAETYCVIVADSDVLIRNSLAEYLRACGYQVIEAASSDEVVTVARAGSHALGAILADIELPGTIGAFELRSWVRSQMVGVDVHLAGTVSKAAKAAGELCEEGPHLKRPYDPQSVVEFIKRLQARTSKPE
ncbi:MAG: response regulator [Novosphingobium sp.]|nr:response regulator [Novosphingobium sp.]